MNAIGDATMALALFLLIQRTGSLELRGRLHAGRRSHGSWAINLDRARAARRRGREVGAAAAAHVAPGRDGGPDAGQRPDPRGDDGDRGRLPDRPHARRSSSWRRRCSSSSAGLGAVTLVMAGLIALVQTDIKRVIAYSTMSQIGYMFLARRARRVRERDVPPDDARLLQGAALPGGRARHPRARRRAGHAQDGRPQPAAAVHVRAASRSARSRSPGIPPFAGFFSKDSILAAALDHGWYGELLWVAGMVGTFLTGALRVPDAVHRLLGRAVARSCSEHLHRHGRALRRGPALDDSTVGVLAVLTVIGGFLQFAGVWTPVTNWLDPVARPLVEASGTQEAVSSDPRRRCSALAGIGVAWCDLRRAHDGARRAVAWAQDLLEHKFYFDEPTTRLLPAGRCSWPPASRAGSSGRSSSARCASSCGASAWPGATRAALQTGLVRTYALAIAASVAVLVVVFVAVRDD